MVTATLAPMIRQSLDASEYTRLNVQTTRLEDFLAFVGFRIEREVAGPLLESNELETEFPELLAIYSKWAYSAVNALSNELCINELQRASEAARELGALFEDRAKYCLGDEAEQSLNRALELGSIVRGSAVAASAAWNTAELETVIRQLMAHDLCIIAVAHYVSEGKGQQSNAQRLASWSFHYADIAYLASGLADSNHDLGTPLSR